MHRLLWEIKCGEDWSERASSLFAGQGSFGNGAAMRVAPVGAFFADDIAAVVEHAARSSVITHTHDEAIAGAIGVAVAVALAHNLGAFALWCAGTHLANYEEALWLTVSGLGDRDTTCAIVGGIVASHTGVAGIPPEWLEARERLPDWPFNEH